MSLDPIKRLLLARLADGRFHSGEVLAKAAAVSRSAVWKRIKVLRDDFGLEIDSVKGKGYRVPSGLELFDSGLIRHYLDAQGDRRHQDLVVLAIMKPICYGSGLMRLQACLMAQVLLLGRILPVTILMVCREHLATSLFMMQSMLISITSLLSILMQLMITRS